MILDKRTERNNDWRVLHVCGDDPSDDLASDLNALCSPRMWR